MRERTRVSLLLLGLSLATACGDDKRTTTLDDAGNPVVGKEGDGSVLPGPDGSVPLDGGNMVIDIDGAVTQLDGAVVLPDGAVIQPDGAIVEPPDAARADAGSQTADAASVDGATGGCDVNDPKYGCGTLSGTTWVTFPGFEVDLTNKVAWTKPETVFDDDALKDVCAASTAGGFTWAMPQMEDVRKLAAGCAKTVTGGSCQVYKDMVLTTEAGDCDCGAGQAGPNNGKFCRPEVPECDTLWVWTHTNEDGFYQHWFYDVTTGSIVHDYVGVGIANEAKGRCFHALADNELPVVTAP